MRLRVLAWLLIGLGLLVGCSSDDPTDSDTAGAAAQAAAAAADSTLEPESPPSADSSTNPRSDSATGFPDAGPAASSRIVVETGAGEIYVIDSDGGNRVDLSGDGVQGNDGRSIARHPVWSPDGRRISWSEVTEDGAAIVTADADGAERRRAGSDFSGYFGYWDPTSNRLGFLGNDGSGTAMVLDDGTGSSLGPAVDNDSFYYYSWSPDGSRWVVHSGSGIRIMSIDGSPGTQVDLEPGRFRAPVWTPNGAILLAVPDEDGNVIVLLDPDTGAVQPVLAVGDITNMVLDKSGRFLAIESVYVAIDEDTDEGDGDSTISDANEEPRLERAEVLVHDLATGETVVAWDNISAGFWWSPDGTTLAVLVGDDQPSFTRWFVWRRGASFLGEPFRLIRNFSAGYVPFFDQFAQSVTPWAPDSSRFVYTGQDESGDGGVFVQLAQPGSPPERITEGGAVAFWSPT